MSFDVDTIEREVAVRLQPLRLALEATGVLVAALPKESGSYSTEVREGIDFVISKATGIGATANTFLGFQDIQYTLSVIISLKLRYQEDPEEKNVLNWVCAQVFKLLFNYQTSKSKTAFSFVDYTPLQPENGIWSAQMQFSCLGAGGDPLTVNANDSLEVQFVQLFGERTEGTAALISQTPNP